MNKALVLLIGLLTLSFYGCESVKPACPECPQKIIKVNTPVPCVIEIIPLEAANLPPKPAFPMNGSEEELKSWALSLGQALEQREKLLLARDAAWLVKVLNNNKALPKCSEVDTTPVEVTQ